jgi:hypothetical protein
MKNYQYLIQMLQQIVQGLEKKKPEIQLYQTKHTFVMGELMVEVAVKHLDDIKLPNLQIEKS